MAVIEHKVKYHQEGDHFCNHLEKEKNRCNFHIWIHIQICINPIIQGVGGDRVSGSSLQTILTISDIDPKASLSFYLVKEGTSCRGISMLIYWYLHRQAISPPMIPCTTWFSSVCAVSFCTLYWYKGPFKPLKLNIWIPIILVIGQYLVAQFISEII